MTSGDRMRSTSVKIWRLILAVVLSAAILPAARLRLLAQATSKPPASGGPGLLRIDGVYRPVKGINLAWLNGQYGHDFGLSPVNPQWGVHFDKGDLARYFDDMARMDLSVVRIWVFEDLEGLRFDGEGYIEGIDPRLLDNYEVALALAREKGLHLYLCLTNNVGKTCRQLGVRDIIADPTARGRYLDRAVKPFVARFKGDGGVFAFDIMNEPEGEVAGRTGNWKDDGYSWSVMRSFIRDNVRAIHGADPRRLVSCGSGWHSFENIKAGIYSGLELDFYDFHVYRNDGRLPPVRELGVDRPVLIGEFNQDNQKEVEDDALQRRAVEAFLRGARDGGYAGALFWDYGHPKAGGVAFLRILRGRGSGEWRPAAAILRDFRWTGQSGQDPIPERAKGSEGNGTSRSPDSR
jgi:hypothetical protein